LGGRELRRCSLLQACMTDRAPGVFAGDLK
jgi:hypothetical protein